MLTFQEILRRLSNYWESQGCIIHQGYDLEVGAGTFNPATALRCLGPEPYNAAYIEPSRRPTDGRYGENPNRLQHYFQYQVILKPSPTNIQDLYLKSLEAIGFNLRDHDIRFVHDDWEAPTLGASGLGWEVWMDGMEVTQFTYFQHFGGISLKPVSGEITYGIERLAMYLLKVESIFELPWSEHLTYGDLYGRNEYEWSVYNFEEANTGMWFRHFEDFEREATLALERNLPLPAYDFVMKASHAFNMLDARGVISVTERVGYIGRIRNLACQVSEKYLESREKLGYPLIGQLPAAEKEEIVVPEVPKALLKGKPDQKADFVLEIGSEELPASFVTLGCQNLEQKIRKLLEKEEIPFDSIETFGTPKRLTAYIHGLAKGKAASSQERRGPPISQGYSEKGFPTPAGEGFFRSLGYPAPALDKIRAGLVPHLTIRTVKDAEYLFATVETPGLPTATLLTEELPKLILSIDFPKKMRWSDFSIEYARPLRWIVALFGEEVIPFRVGPIVSGRESRGHRQLHAGRFPLPDAASYVSILRKYKVQVSMEERKGAILEQIKDLEKEHSVHIIEKERVINEVVNLVEWPQLAIATFDSAFLKAPKEVLISEMVEHQKYFPVSHPDGSLKNVFVITADTTPTEQICQGNERVLSARLADGVFLYEKGESEPLDFYVEKLKQVTFHKKLGSLWEKVERVQAHGKLLQKKLSLSTPEQVLRAAYLCKADLATEMVFEFPELQGTIGRYYATAKQEDPEVAQAIEEHWMPKGEKAPLPQTPTGIVLSIADKIDNLLGGFSVGLKPTSSSDPYALRRQALGIIRIIIQNKLRVPLFELFRLCFAHFPEPFRTNEAEVLRTLEEFFLSRIKTVFLDYGVSKDEVEASLATGCSEIYDALCKAQALHQFRETEAFPLVYEVYKRAKGQLNGIETEPFRENLLSEQAEKSLDSILNTTSPSFEAALAEHNYSLAYALIAKIQPALATLFAEVKILDEEEAVRRNRIALLQRVFALFGQLLDFSKIQEK